MLAVCIFTAGAMVTLPVESFTLAGVHSIEKVRWEEDYRIAGSKHEAVTAGIKGSAAGMEPPAGAVLKDGWWHYRPALTRRDELRLTRSAFTADYQVCTAGTWRSLAEIAPQAEGRTLVRVRIGCFSGRSRSATGS